MIKLAVFGAGRIGYVHALNAASLPSVRLEYIVDPIPSAHLDDLETKTGARVVEADTVFADPSIDGVIIASSTDTHAELILKAVAAGKSMFCEKPISLNFKLVTEVAEAVAKAKTPCMLGFQRRYDPNFRLVRERIQSGVTGRLEQLVMHTRDPSPPPVEYVKRSGGMFRDMTIHDFDMARFIMGEEPVSVYAQGSNLVDPAIGEAGDIDTAFIVLKYASGAMATIVNSRRSSYGYDQRLELHGSEGLLCAGNILENQVQHYGKQGCTSALPEHFFLQRYKSAYAAEWEHFVAVLRGEAVPDCSGDDGERALYLADKALESLRSQREIVL